MEWRLFSLPAAHRNYTNSQCLADRRVRLVSAIADHLHFQDAIGPIARTKPNVSVEKADCLCAG